MARRGRRDDDFDDSLERSHGTVKRVKRGDKKEEPSSEEATPVVVVDEAAKIERLRAKNKTRKDRKKAKAQERLDEAKEQKERRAADALKPKEEQTKYDTVTSRLGVTYQDMVLGKGPVVQDRKKVHVKYALHKHNKTGKKLDSNDNFGFRLGKAEVIAGWDIGLEGMRQGGVRHLMVPPEAGYGKKDIGAGPGGILFFKVTLLSC
jgi:FK506-binding nuclear protein